MPDHHRPVPASNDRRFCAINGENSGVNVDILNESILGD